MFTSRKDDPTWQSLQGTFREIKMVQTPEEAAKNAEAILEMVMSQEAEERAERRHELLSEVTCDSYLDS